MNTPALELENGPIQDTHRIMALDALRGFALFGIMFVNITWFSGYAVLGPDQRAGFSTAGIDEPLYWWIHLLVDGKFWSLFALMFGVGLAIQIERAQNRLSSVASILSRRLIVLFLIGMLHGILFWFGDIISLYAVTAFGVLAFYRLPNRVLIWIALAFLLLPILQSGCWLWIVEQMRREGEEIVASGHGPGALLPNFAEGNYLEALQANWAFLKERWVLAVYEGRFFKLLGMMLLGLVAYRSIDLESVWTQRKRWLIWAALMLLIGLPGNVILANWSGQVTTRPPTFDGWVFSAVQTIAIPSLCIAYGLCLLLLITAIPQLAVWPGLAKAGRLSLTHYLSQSVIGIIIFYGCGFGQWAQFGLTWAVLIVLLIFAFQVLFSHFWLARFRQGPLEWICRVLIYKMRLPMRRRPE